MSRKITFIIGFKQDREKLFKDMMELSSKLEINSICFGESSIQAIKNVETVNTMDRPAYDFAGAEYKLMGFSDLHNMSMLQFGYLISRARFENNDSKVIACFDDAKAAPWLIKFYDAWSDGMKVFNITESNGFSFGKSREILFNNMNKASKDLFKKHNLKLSDIFTDFEFIEA